MLKSFRSTEASSGEALNGDEICSLGPSPLEDVLFELIGFQWTRRFLLIERFNLLRGRMFERRGRRAESSTAREEGEEEAAGDVQGAFRERDELRPGNLATNRKHTASVPGYSTVPYRIPSFCPDYLG